MKPTIPPISPASSTPPAAFSGPASGPLPVCCSAFSMSGASVPRIVIRFAFAHAARSTASGGGSSFAGSSREYATTRVRASVAIAARSPGSGLPASPFGDPATAPATRSAISQSITSGSSLVGRPLELRGGHGGELGERRLGTGGDDRRVRLEVERRRQRLVAGGEGDMAAALADDELGGGGVDRAAVPQRRHAVDPRRGDLAQRDRDRAHRAHAPGHPLQG